MSHTYKSDIIIIGGGLAGIVTAIELPDHNQNVIILERDKKEKFGGLAKESFDCFFARLYRILVKNQEVR